MRNELTNVILNAQKMGSVIITKVSPDHTFPCVPSCNQYVKARKVSGELTQYTKLALGDIVNYLWLDSFISPRLIRAILRRVFPNGQTLDYSQINNARLRAQIVVEKARLKGIDPTNLVSMERLPALTKKLDFDSQHILDEAVISANKIKSFEYNTRPNKNYLTIRNWLKHLGATLSTRRS